MDVPFVASDGLVHPRGRFRYYLLAFFFAVVGGLLGILGAFVAEARSSAPLLAVFLGAPIVEEITKPAGLYLYMLRWRDVLRSQLYIAGMVAISGLCFGLLESLVYVTLYAPNHSKAFFIYRFTVTVGLHALASFVAGLGINGRLIDWANGNAPFPKRARNAFLGAIAVHSIYNTTVTILALTGTLQFD